MDVLITGGSGFVGRALSEHLSAHAHRVCVLSRNPQAARQHLAPNVRILSRLAEVGDVDAVVNLQGENLASGRWTAARKRAFVDSRVAFTRELVQWMAAQTTRPAQLISASAIGWYGDRADEPLTEQAGPGDDYAARLCRDWEHEAMQAEALGLRVQRLRIGVVLDRQGGALAKMLPAFKLGGGGPIGSGAQWMSWITRHDLVRLLSWLLLDSAAPSGVYNATAPSPLRQKDFAKALGQALRRPAVLHMPAFALRALFGEMAELLLGSQRVLPQAALERGFRFDHADIHSALRSLL